MSGNLAKVRERPVNLCSPGNLIAAANKITCQYFIRTVINFTYVIFAENFNKCALVRHIACNFVWKSRGFFSVGRVLTLNSVWKGIQHCRYTRLQCCLTGRVASVTNQNSVPSRTKTSTFLRFASTAVSDFFEVVPPGRNVRMGWWATRCQIYSGRRVPKMLELHDA